MQHARFWPDPSILDKFLKGQECHGYDIKPFGANAVTVALGDHKDYIGRKLLGLLAESTALPGILPDALAEITGKVKLVEDLSEDTYKKNKLEATDIEGRFELEMLADGMIVVRNGFSVSACFRRIMKFDPRMINELVHWIDPDWSVRALACHDHETEESTLDFLPKQDEHEEGSAAANDNIPVADSPDVIAVELDDAGEQEVERFFPLVVVGVPQVEESEEVLATEVVDTATANPPAIIYLGSKRNDGQEGDPCDSWEGFKPTDRLPRLVLRDTQRVEEGQAEADILHFLEQDEDEIDNIFVSGPSIDDAAWDGCMAGLAAAYRSRRDHMAAK